MLKKIPLLLLSLGLPLMASMPAIAQQPFAAAIAQQPPIQPYKPLVKETVAQAIRQDAIQRWNFPQSGRVEKIERITLQDLKGLEWISATVPTWKITLTSADQRMIYFTNDFGSVKLVASRENLTLIGKVPSSVIQAAQRAAVHYWEPRYQNNITTLKPAQILIKEATPTTWNNGCLDAPNSGEGCTRGQVKGWRIVAEGPRPRPCTNCIPQFLMDSLLFFRTDELGQQVRVDLPAVVTQSAFTLAQSWALNPNTGRIIGAESIRWMQGCTAPRGAPHLCPPAFASGWMVKIEHQGQRWKIKVDQRGQQTQLIRRENIPVDATFDEQLAKQVKLLAAKHFSIDYSHLRIMRAEPKDFGACLGLPSPVEKCGTDRSQAYRVTVEGKPGQQQVYRISYFSGIRTEANNGMPPRTDDLPNPIAQKIFQDARSRLKTNPQALRIVLAESVMRCEKTSPPDKINPACPVEVPGGWRVSVTNFRNHLVYQISPSGKIESVKNQ